MDRCLGLVYRNRTCEATLGRLKLHWIEQRRPLTISTDVMIPRSLRSVRKLSTPFVSHTGARILRRELNDAPGVIQWGYGQHVADLPKSIAHSAMPLKVSILTYNNSWLHRLNHPLAILAEPNLLQSDHSFH